MGSSKSLAVFAAGAALVVSGCTGGEPEADPTPILPESSEPAEPSPSDPSESETAQAEAPEMPDAARERSLNGAEAFATHWVDAFNHATATGATEDLRSLSSSSCSGCSAVADQIDEVYEAGGRIESNGWEVRQVGFNQDDEVSDPDLAVRIDRSPQRFVRDDSAERYPGGLATYLFSLSWSDGTWTLDVLDLLE